MAAFDFPTSPSDGDTYQNYIYDATIGAWHINNQQENARFTVSSTAPANPVTGDAWFDNTEGITYIYYHDGDTGQWVETGNPVLSYMNLDSLTDVNSSTAANGQALVYNGSEWIPGSVESGLHPFFGR